MTTTLTGAVESIGIDLDETYEEHTHDDDLSMELGVTPGKLRVKLALHDMPAGEATTAYISTKIGYRERGAAGWTIWVPSEAQKRNAWPWAIPAPDEPDGYLLTIWVGDVVTVSGDVSERTSQRGNHYLQVQRVILDGVVRPDWDDALLAGEEEEWDPMDGPIHAPGMPEPGPVNEFGPLHDRDAWGDLPF
jgi:hypothetical protein